MSDKKVFLESRGIVKKFGTVKALDNVNLEVCLGEIRGLIGENGSGKSTISSIISGINSATEGEMFIKGKPYMPHSPLDARNNRISMIVQEKGTIDMLSITDNIFLGEEERFKKFGFINVQKMNEQAKIALENVGLGHLDVTLPISTLNFETRKLVEIAKALYYDPELFIVDETTTALSQEGREKIHAIMRQLKSEGKAVLFISHDLPELMETCDCLTVLRDGVLVENIQKQQFEEQYIKKTMVGRAVAEHLYRTDYLPYKVGPTAVRVEHVFSEGVSDVSFELHEGEILGLSGLSGSGMHEIGKVIFGMEKVKKGEVYIYDTLLKGITHALEMKVGYISKDRDTETLILNESIQDNLTISALDMLKKLKLLILPKDEKKFAEAMIEQLSVKCSSPKQLVRELSGGNKQKISFGKLIGNKSKILILDSPTRGVDVGVKATMYKLIAELKDKGYAILLISEELPELIGMSDRILMFKAGKVTKEFLRSETLRDVDVIEYMI